MRNKSYLIEFDDRGPYPEFAWIVKTGLGFTLLEILIALFIFTIISMITVNALHVITQSQSRVENHNAKINAIQTTMLLLSRDLVQAIDRPIMNAAGELEPGLLGQQNSISFTHTGVPNPNAKFLRSTLQRVRYQQRDNHFFKDLWPVLDQAANTQASSLSLLSDVSEIQFQYLDKNNQFQPMWPPSQDPNIGLPKAVQIKITFKDNTALTQLMIIAAEKITTNASEAPKPAPPEEPKPAPPVT